MEPMEVARSVIAGYADQGNVAAAMVAGSLGRGSADRHSDIEVDVYWASPPTDAQRRSAVEAAGGDLTALWPYEPDEGEWSEDFGVGDHDVTISGFTVDWLEGTIARRGRFNLIAQLRLSALHEGQPLLGNELVQQWRRTSSYPDELAVDTIGYYLAAAPLSSWRQWPALVERHDSVPLHDLCAEMISSMLGMLCGVNHIYVSHPRFKWTARTIQRFSLVPQELSTRLSAALDAPTAELAHAIDTLYRETLTIAHAAHPSGPLGDALAAGSIASGIFL